MIGVWGRSLNVPLYISHDTSHLKHTDIIWRKIHVYLLDLPAHLYEPQLSKSHRETIFRLLQYFWYLLQQGPVGLALDLSHGDIRR